MPDGAKHFLTAAKLASEARGKFRFLPAAALPPELPNGPIAIADMASAFRVTHRTLHFYEEKGLISASRVGLMRVYDLGDVLRMAVINICRDIGMSIAAIQIMMTELGRAETQEAAETIFHDALAARKRELTSEVAIFQRQAQRITELMEYDSAAETERLNDNHAPSALTTEERRYLTLMAQGHSTTKIARALAIRAEMAKSLEASIIAKFGAGSRFQAIAKAVLLGIVKP